MDGQSSELRVDPFKTFRVLWRGKWLIALTTLAGLALAILYSLELADRTYSAHATVALNSREGQVVEFESVVSGLGADPASIYTEIEVLRSRNLAGKVVDSLGLIEREEFNPALRPQKLIPRLLGRERQEIPAEQQRDLTIDATLRAIEVVNIRQSKAFRITVVTKDPRQSTEIANSIAQFYIRDQLELKLDATERATSWLSDRVAQLKIELEDANAEVKAFESQMSLIDPETLMGMNRQLKELRDRVTNTAVDLARADSRVASLNAVRASGDITAMASAADERSLNTTLRQVDQGTTSVATFLERFDRIIQREEFERDRLTNENSSLQRTVADLEGEIRRQSDDLIAIEQLQREAEASRLIYEHFLNRLKETSVQESIHTPDARVLSDAFLPRSPVWPRLSLLGPLGIIAGFLFGALWVIIREMRANTFRSGEELDGSFSLPLLGQIPMMPIRKRQSLLDYLRKKQNSAAAEAMRNARTSVLMSNVENPPEVIMVTSTVPAEGKTTHAIMFAMSCAALGKRVLLVEGDIRRRVFNRYFGIEAGPGLVSVINGDAPLESAVVDVSAASGMPEDRLHVLQGENSTVNAADLYTSADFKTFIDQVRDAFDIVVIDTPPVLAVTDARIIGQQVDSIVYMVRWDKTPKDDVRDGLRLLTRMNLPIAGLLLTQVDIRGLSRYGYGSYRSYKAYKSGYVKD